MDKHMEKVDELLGKLSQAANAKGTKKMDLAGRLADLRGGLAILKRQLDAAILGDSGEDERLIGEIREAKKSLGDLEQLHDRIDSAKVESVVTPNHLISAFLEATQGTRKDVNAAEQRALEAKKAYEESLTELERICSEHGRNRGRVDAASKLHFNQVIDGQLPRIAPSSDPYMDYRHYRERKN